MSSESRLTEEESLFSGVAVTVIDGKVGITGIVSAMAAWFEQIYIKKSAVVQTKIFGFSISSGSHIEEN
jgi:hypothetical protein